MVIILLTVAKLKTSLAKVANAIHSCHGCHFRQPYISISNDYHSCASGLHPNVYCLRQIQVQFNNSSNSCQIESQSGKS